MAFLNNFCSISGFSDLSHDNAHATSSNINKRKQSLKICVNWVWNFQKRIFVTLISEEYGVCNTVESKRYAMHGRSLFQIRHELILRACWKKLRHQTHLLKSRLSSSIYIIEKIQPCLATWREVGQANQILILPNIFSCHMRINKRI